MSVTENLSPISESGATPKTGTTPTVGATPAPSAPSSSQESASPSRMAGVDVGWVWREVRKRVFIKLPFSMGVADALESVVPIVLEDDIFVVGFEPRDYPLSSHLMADQVHNTIQNILRQAAGRAIRFEIVEGTTLDDWHTVQERRAKAHAAVMAMAEQQAEAHHFEDVLNQIVSEIRQRVTASRDRILPQVRAQLILDVVPSLADAEDMLFADPNAHESRRSMARALDRVASFLEINPVMLALEVERHRRDNHVKRVKASGVQAATAPAESEPTAPEPGASESNTETPASPVPTTV